MKKTVLLLVLSLAFTAAAQQSPATSDQAVSGSAQQSAMSDQATPSGTVVTSVNFPIERIPTPTYSDVSCAGFVSQKLVPDANFISGGLDTPNTTKYGRGELVYLSGKGYELGKRYSILRELRDPNRYEIYPGQFAQLKAMGQPYADLGTVQIIDTRHREAIGHIEMSCGPMMPGDIVTPYVEKASIPARGSLRFDRFLPSTGKASGRIVMAKDFDTELGTGMKVYLNLGANQGVKPGDYMRAVRSYEADLHNPADSLSFDASTADDTQAKPPSIESNMLNRSKGPVIHVADLPRRSVGEIVILSATPTTSTGMIVFALEDVHIGDVVELDPQ
jgi:hypothetical protein